MIEREERMQKILYFINCADTPSNNVSGTVNAAEFGKWCGSSCEEDIRWLLGQVEEAKQEGFKNCNNQWVAKVEALKAKRVIESADLDGRWQAPMDTPVDTL